MIHEKKITISIGPEGIGVKTSPKIKGILKHIKVFVNKPVAILIILDELDEVVISEFLSNNKFYSPKTQGDVGVEHKKYSFNTSDYFINETVTFAASGPKDTKVTFLMRWIDG